jgi:hypothetical protein
MTRNEGDAQVPVDREIIRQEVRAELRRENRARMIRGCAINLLLFALFFLLPAYYLASMVAKSGLVEVPLLTNWQYRPAEYTRRVVPLVGSNTEQIMRSVAAKATFDVSTSSIMLSMSEGQLTNLIMAAVHDAGDSLPFKISSIQAAILPGTIEIYAVIPRPERFVTAVIRFALAVTDGKIEVRAQQLQIGALQAPKALADMVTPVLSRGLNDLLTQSASGVGQISEISLQDGRMVIKLSPKGK